MLKLTLPGGRAVWFVAAHIKSVHSSVDHAGTYVTLSGDEDSYRVLEEPPAIAAKLSALLGVEVLTAME